MIKYIQLIRPINISIVAMTLLFFRYFIIDVNVYQLYDFKPYLDTFSFYILLITTLSITASGYIINDIFDVETDQINKPQSLIIGQSISEKAAMNFYFILTSIGIIGSIVLMITTGQIKLSMIPMIVSVLLYLYSTTFKKMLLLGNVVIAICVALPIIFLSMYELRINEFDPAVVILFTQGIGLASLSYGIFAFMTTLIREIIKDVQDMEGDDVIGAKTFPILLGIKASKTLIILLQLLTLSILLLVDYYFLTASVSIAFYGTSILLVLPLLIQIILVIWAKVPSQFKWASLAGKIHVLLGVCTMIYFGNGTAPHIFNQMFNFLSQLTGMR
ncbi:MAG: geranylgeranylglycerol-phosphate geranylgeranyltransferase [Chitinophagales bacterium]|nr:geranylgeranylglycerol-phosphate geranylgeranyltransferase [Chitinophagales bacterium]MCZ2394327.1 geranylgeranylglycerol-phosphate geranylgeranyltransferase [Chitinophagales bacterium]